MSNNLKKIEKDLRAFAKRCKDVKYTQALLYIFLMTGALSFTATSTATTAESIEGARKEIKTSITDMKKLFKDAKRENNKLMKQSNLELIQLMEQGDQAVKSPWSSWQYGMNYFYNDWTGTYKGRGDKTPNVKYERNPAGKFGNYLGGKFGKTNLSKKVIEPISAVPIDAAVRPKNIDKTPPTFTVAGADGGFPSFETRTVPSISRIEITTPAAISTFNPPALSFVGSGFWQGQGIGTRFNGGSVSSSVYIENYTSYDTDGIFRITMEADDETVNWTGKMTATSTEDSTKNITMSPSGTYTGPTSGAIQARLNAFINELRDHDATIGGTYIFENKGTRQKTFLSHNPAGVHTTDGMTIGRTATFTGTLD